MPRYFFNVHDGHSCLDTEGTELADLDTARREALRFAGQVIEDQNQHNTLGKDWRLEIADETGLVLYQLLFQVTETPAVGVLRGERGGDGGARVRP